MTKPIVYTPNEAAAALGVTRQTIYAMVKRGELTMYKVGRCSRFRIDQVHALVGASSDQ